MAKSIQRKPEHQARATKSRWSRGLRKRANIPKVYWLWLQLRHIFSRYPLVLTDFFNDTEHVCGWELWPKAKFTHWDLCASADDGWTAGDYGPSMHRRLWEEGRGEACLCADPGMKWNLQVAICKSHNEENGIMRSGTASPRSGSSQVLKCHPKAGSHSLCSSSRHVLAWPCFCDNYQRQFKEQAAQKGFGVGQPSVDHPQARE